MSRCLLIVCLFALASLSTDVQAQWYASADFMAPRRSINTDAVFQREVVTEFTRTVDFESEATTTTSPEGDTETVVVETPVRLEEITETFVGDRSLSADDIDFGRAAAGRLTVGRRIGYFGLESSFLWTESWEGGASVSDPSGNLAGPFARPGALLNQHVFIENVPEGTIIENIDFPEPGMVHLNTFAEIDYKSQLMTGDIDALGVLIEAGRGTVTGLAGFRFAELKEQFGYESISALDFEDSPVNSPSQEADVRNRLFGPQIGLMIASPITERAFLTLSAKTAIAYNRVERQTLWLPDVADPESDVSHESRDSRTSLLGDFSIGGNIFVTPNLAIRMGFDVLTIGDVALATDNFRTDIDSLSQSDTAINHRSRVVYYSPTIGAMLSF